MAQSDQIGSLGLDVSEFEAGITLATNKIAEAIRSTNLLNTAVGLSAAAIAIWAKNFVDAKLRAEQMDKAIQGVARTLSSSEFSTQSGLETRLKEVDDLLTSLQSKRSLSDIFIQKVSDAFTGKNRDAEEDRAGTMALEKKREIEGQIAEKIRAQTNLMQLQRTQGKDVVEMERIRLEFAEKRGAVTAANGRITDAELKALKEQEKEAIQGILDKQKKITEELVKQNEVTKLMRLGNSTAARKLQSENEFDRQIREAYKNGNGALAEQLEQQQRESRMAFAIEERNKSPEQRREERRARRQYISDERKVYREDAELDRRIARGVRGTPGSRIERRREEIADAATRAQNVRKNLSPMAKQGYGATDSANLQTIADAFTGGAGSGAPKGKK